MYGISCWNACNYSCTVELCEQSKLLNLNADNYCSPPLKPFQAVVQLETTAVNVKKPLKQQNKMEPRGEKLPVAAKRRSTRLKDKRKSSSPIQQEDISMEEEQEKEIDIRYLCQNIAL